MHKNLYEIQKLYYIIVSNLEIKVFKKVLKEVVEKYDGAEDFINSSIDEICSQEKLSAAEVI